MMDKKPDQVVYNTTTQRYDAKIKPYATNVGAPKITPTDTSTWKVKCSNAINLKVKANYQKLQQQYNAMLLELEYHQLILEAEFSFTPITGQIYHLYTRDNGTNFLSLIPKEQCRFNFIGSFYLNAEQIWEKTQ